MKTIYLVLSEKRKLYLKTEAGESNTVRPYMPLQNRQWYNYILFGTNFQLRRWLSSKQLLQMTRILTTLWTAYFYCQMTLNVRVQQPRAVLMVIQIEGAVSDHYWRLEDTGVLIDNPVTANQVVLERILRLILEPLVGPAVLRYRVHQIDRRPRLNGNR